MARAHEFWLDAVDYAPKVGARVPIVHRNGINFLGDSYPVASTDPTKFLLPGKAAFEFSCLSSCARSLTHALHRIAEVLRRT